MGETIAVLFIFFILLVGGLIFYARIQKGTIEREIDERRGLDAIDVAQRAAYLPELQCSSEDVPKMNCLDLYKLKAFDDDGSTIVDTKKTLYYDRFFYSHIYVVQIYPVVDLDLTEPGDQLPSWTVYDNWKAEDELISNITTQIPVSIFDPAADDGQGETYFGVLVVEVLS